MILTDEVLLVLRTGIAFSLYLFLGVLLWMLWRDVQGRARAEQERSRRAWLTVMESNDTNLKVGSEFVLLPLTTLGRNKSSSILFNGTFASSDHARVYWQQGQWWIEDSESHNGTFLNGQNVEEPIVLTTGDIIRIGLVKLRFESR